MNDKRWAPRTATSRQEGTPSVPDAELAGLARALGHPARVAIVKMLMNGNCVCGDIVDRLPLAQATVSQHLKVLKEAGLIRGDIDPPRVCYCINPDSIQKLKTLVGDL